MDKVIFKYQIPISDQFNLWLPVGAVIRSLDKGHRQIGSQAYLWVEHNYPLKNNEDREFRFFGTGHTITADNHTYIDTLHDEGYVWHLYEVTK
jgi:hypothetical protein